MGLTNNHFTEVILDSLGEGLFTVDKEFRINTFNRAAERILGIKKEEAIGDYCKNVMKSIRCFEECPLGRVLETGKNIYDFESELHHRSGRSIPVKINAAVLKDYDNSPIGGVISFRDMSYLEAIKSDLLTRSNFHGIIGQDKSMQEIYTLIEEVAESDSNVLIQGESGTGKEMVADAIQKTSRRHDKPFIKINCSVFPPQMLASELFGHVKGAYTDAIKDRVGRFEMADGGTIFLDEVAEMPLQMQVQLLRVLQEGTFERVGESITRKVNVRVIAATNKNIEACLKDGSFREDLYYRLNVIPVYVPPLRERKSDIPHLVQYFINRLSLIQGKKVDEADDEAMDILVGYDWPGNVRELANAIEYAFARTKDNVIHASKLPPQVRLGSCVKSGNNQPIGRNNHNNHSEEYITIRSALERNRWNRSMAARELGMGRTTLWRKMKALGLEIG
ncbi:MAG TPA: PAS domain-containing protein [Caldithrix abyssi]|uniref:PAS domain-containing protein n=1 Tax=Caldithrix abyssi TaxID=187145 RepID=A0A7V4U1I5_CALAY|nr:PAS domain-containing protein [Caldithrix abyssi]